MNIRRDQKGKPIKPKRLSRLNYKELIDSRLPPDVGNDPGLRAAWGGCVSCAMRNPDIVAGFKAETGLTDEKASPSILGRFLDWFNQNLWPHMRDEVVGLVAEDRREAECDVVILEDPMLKAVLIDRAAQRGMSVPEYVDYLGRDVIAAPMDSITSPNVDALAELKSAIDARLNKLKQGQSPAVPTTIM